MKIQELREGLNKLSILADKVISIAKELNNAYKSFHRFCERHPDAPLVKKKVVVAEPEGSWSKGWFSDETHTDESEAEITICSVCGDRLWLTSTYRIDPKPIREALGKAKEKLVQEAEKLGFKGFVPPSAEGDLAVYVFTSDKRGLLAPSEEILIPENLRDLAKKIARAWTI